MRVSLNVPQYKAVSSNARLILFIAGLGAGKSSVSGYWTRDRICIPGSFGLILAGTKEQLRDSTMPRLLEAWERMGIVEDEHFVIGKRPPKHWGVKAWSKTNNSNIITFRWGAYAKLGSVDNYNSHRGPECDWIYGDEWRDWKDKAVDVLYGRLRGKAIAAAGRKAQLLLCTTPPDDPQFVQKYFALDDVEIVRATTYDNEANLPTGYIDSLKQYYDELTFRREVLGELINSAGAPAYYCFSEESYSDLEYDPSKELYLCYDFNVGAKPMCCIMVQVDDMGRPHAVKEFVHYRSNTKRTTQAVVQYLQDSGHKAKIYVTGDYAGTRNESNADVTDYEIILTLLSKAGYNNVKLVTIPTPTIRYRVGTTNAMLLNLDGVRRLFVNKQQCPALAADLHAVQWDKSGTQLDDSRPERTHPSDAFSYYTMNFHPIAKKEVRISNA